MVRQEHAELVDDRNLARLAGLGRNELLSLPVPTPVNVNPAALNIDGDNIERE